MLNYVIYVRYPGQYMSAAYTELSAEELAELQQAYERLEHPSLAARLCNVIGTPVEQGLRLLPKGWYQRLHQATEASIRSALDVALASVGRIAPNRAHDSLHKLLVMGTGALGGFLGPLTLLAELPVTTTLMLRSIADIAHSEGEDLTALEGRLACMEVFALGGRTREDKAADAGYYSLRLTLGLHFSNALLHTQVSAGNTANIPGGVDLIRAIASRFGVVVSDEVAAKMIPIAGAVSGALINLVFLDHFQDTARGHFVVRRLERKYGTDVIRDRYEQLARQEAEGDKEFSPLEGW